MPAAWRWPARSRARVPPVVLAHGLTATRRYVVMGSRVLQRGGHRVIAYDARAHGRSDPAADPGDYGYPAPRRRPAGRARRPRDRARRARRGVDGRPHADGVRARAPRARRGARAADARVRPREQRPAAARALGPAGGRPARRRRGGLRRGPRDAARGPRSSTRRSTASCISASPLTSAPRPSPTRCAPFPRSRPFERWEDLAAIDVPTVVVVSRDEADPEHPYAIGERYAGAIAGARLVIREARRLAAGLAGRAGLARDQRAGRVCGSRAMSSSAHSTTSSRSYDVANSQSSPSRRATKHAP